MSQRLSVMVSGADGLVGRHIVRMLLDNGVEHVIAITRRGPRPVDERLHWINADLCKSGDVDAMASLRPGIIVHAAAALPRSLDDVEASERNARMDAHLLALARTAAAGFIYLSSQSVYERCALPWTEVLPVAPSSRYAAGKYRSERQVLALPQVSAILRISSPYSAATSERSSVLYHFVREAIAGHCLQVKGQGTRCQDFVHAADIACAVGAIVAAWRDKTRAMFTGIFNVASGRPISMIELAKLVVASCGAGEISFSGVDPEASFRAEISIKRADEILGWQPRVPLQAGIEQLIRRFRGLHEDWLAV